MDYRTFQASTMSAALAEVKQELGPGAVILQTRSFKKSRWLGLRSREIFEITAGRDARGAVRPRASAARQPAVLPVKSSAAPPAKPPAEARRQLLESPAGQNAAMAGIFQEMTGLKAMIQLLVTETNRSKCPQIPDELFEHYSHLIENQVAETLAADMIKTLQKQMRPEHLRQGDFVRMKLAEQIEKHIPAAGPIHRSKASGPHVVALIGPTGVGKTTTLAKLAANLKLRENRRVGFITLDTYRIAAIDQLKKYADILGAPLRVVATSEELVAAVRSMQDCEYVLIDTAGRSPRDALKLIELKGMLAVVNPDEVHLVLSSTASQKCVELAVAKFSEVRVDKIIFTKIDEAAHVGVVLNVINKVNKSLSYVTTGQNVPDDIEVGEPKRLAELILSQPGRQLVLQKPH
jgi:flagellar biosynthesis protein FlhF